MPKKTLKKQVRRRWSGGGVGAFGVGVGTAMWRKQTGVDETVARGGGVVAERERVCGTAL